ncbi:GldG family protein [bacterium]|nr:GldG family protein [bacterium]
MTGKAMGLFFIGSLYLLIIVYHFFHNVWLMEWPKYVIWGLLCCSSILWVFTGVARFKEFAAQKNVRFFVGLSFFVAALLIVLGVGNWYVASQNKVWDLTKNQSNSLSEQSLNILEGLESEMTMEVWTRSLPRMSQGMDAERFFKNYENAANGKLKLVVKDPNSFPVEAKELRIARDPTIIIRSSEGRENRVETFNENKAEESVTNAIIQTLKGQKKTVCFLGGHKELDLNEKGPQGLSSLRDGLEFSAYEAREVLLLTHDKMPEYCEVLVIAGPQSEPIEKEITIIKEYISSGGPTLALFGPEVPNMWQNIFKDYNVKINNDVIVDQRVQKPVLGVLTANYNPDVKVFASFSQPVFLRFVSSVSSPEKLEGFDVHPFVSSESVSFTRAGGLKALGNSLSPRAGDKQGPHAIGVLIEGEKVEKKESNEEDGENAEVKADEAKPVKIAVVGSYLFAANGLIVGYSNKDFLLSAINYLSGDADIVGIRPRTKSTAKLQLTIENLLQVQGFILLAASVFIVMGVWAFRRKRAA